MITKPIKAFCIDFNHGINGPAHPGLFAQADPGEHVRWYTELGANTIQTFCVSYNGHAWYPSSVAPVTPGMKGNFLGELTELAHHEGMQVMGYFCLGANPVWEQMHPDQTHGEVAERIRITFTSEYIDYFCRSIADALCKSDVDGFMIDWFRPPFRNVWLDCEKAMFRELMSRSFPASGELEAAELIEFDRRMIERAWIRIKETIESTRKAIIWTNQPFEKVDDPLWNGHRLLREVDWVLNEGVDVGLLAWLKKQVGPHTKIIQNMCGWGNHDARSLWKQVDVSRFGLYGYAQADPVTTFPSATYTPGCAVNQKNIEIIREAYHAIR